MRPRRLALITTFSAVSYAIASSSAHDSASANPLEFSITAEQGLVRSSRAIYTFAANSIDYKYSLRGLDYKSDEYLEIRSMVHSRAAKRILKLCEANKGFYIKAGQFVASLQHLPKEYTSILSALQDQALPCAFEVIEVVLKEEFGWDVMDMFEEFDKQPIAAASIAQVHRARLKNNQEVAVKLFPDYQFQWIIPEFEKTSLKELDFEEEGHNAERTARFFERNKYVKIPKIFWDKSSHRVLTMEFVHGCKIDDVEVLRTAGIDPQKVARVLVEIFAQMIFVHGCVHGDPHPGNILVHGQTGRFQIVLLDHGLYRELEESFRIDFCRLWKALVLGDTLEAQRVGERLGAGKFFKFLPIIFMGRTMESTSGLGERMSDEERRKLRDEMRLLTFGDVSQFMEGLPRDLLIVLRTDGLLRSIISKLGAQPWMRLLVNAKHAVSGLSHRNSYGTGARRASGVAVKKPQFEYLNLQLRLELLEMTYKLKDLYGSFLQLLGRLRKRLPQWLKGLNGYMVL
ncbi:hypothetical protein GOP47_0017793 [Adiantum capillus-veneris]|uniref:ABC1 atypical kinase-like domain-containing protein n=1 Tax=Adiantum capillus-veneris TaxID=13818 RepID=A0A9D4UG44_ADICA|nr:hypothetical protein GOP47_0017793 [Adiantum capillus-veneris]